MVNGFTYSDFTCIRKHQVNCKWSNAWSSISDELQALLAESDDDDDAPDDLGFEESRKTVLSTVKAAMDQIQRSKDIKKMKRKKQEEMYAQQKVGSISSL